MCLQVHANYLKGNHAKMYALKKFGYWLAVEGEGKDGKEGYTQQCRVYEQRTCQKNPRMCTKGG